MAFTYTKRKDGRLMKRVNVCGKQQTLYSYDAKDLEKQWIEAKSLDIQNKQMPQDISFKDFAEKWIEINSAGKAEATVKEYKYIINTYLINKIGNIKLKNLRKIDIQDIQKELLENEHYELSQKVIRFAKAILNEATENNYMQKNVAINIKSPKVIHKEKEILTKEEDELLIDCANTHKHGFFFLLLRYTGMRKEEIAALTVDDIDLENKIIKINKAVTFIHNQPKIKTTKNKKSREIPILDVVSSELEKRINYCKNNKIKYLFTKQTDSKSMLSDSSIKRMLESFLLEINNLNKKKIQDNQEADDSNNEQERIGLKEIKFSLHQLRHSYCTMLYYANIKLKEAQRLMGHSSADMVYNIYTHLDSQKEDSLNSLNEYLKN